jgi:hypothetical protein
MPARRPQRKLTANTPDMIADRIDVPSRQYECACDPATNPRVVISNLLSRARSCKPDHSIFS